MTRPRLLDLFCGAGGCTRGYVTAGFEVVGVDIKPQRRYLKSGGSEFVLADAMEYARDHGHEYDAIHASPPCQRYSRLGRLPWVSDDHPMLIDACVDLLSVIGKPWVVENVEDAKPIMEDAITLCGLMFGLRVYRHRMFLSSEWIWAPEHVPHPRGEPRSGPTPLNGLRGDGYHMTVAGHFAGVAEARKAMGIDWMSRDELSQAIPPAYTEWIGKQLINHVRPSTERTDLCQSMYSTSK